MRPARMKSIIALIALTTASGVIAADDNSSNDIKQMKGISIQGDKEAPKSLYIVPWHTAEHKQSTSLSTSLVSNEMKPVDHDSFVQQLRLYELSKSGWYRLTPDTP